MAHEPRSADFHVPFLDVSRDGPYLPARGFRLARDRRRGLIAAMGAQEMAEAIDEVAHLELHRSFEFVMPLGKISTAKIAREEGVPVRNKGPTLRNMIYDPEHRAMFSGREDGTIVFWKARIIGEEVSSSGEPSYLRGHRGRVGALLSLRACPGHYVAGTLVSGGADGTLRVWDPRKDPSIAQLQKLTGHEGGVVALEQVGGYVASGSTDRTVVLWRPGDPPADVVKTSTTDRYPWFERHRRLAVFDGWVNSLSFGSTGAVGDFGALYVGTSSGETRRVRARSAPSAPGGVAFDTSAVPETSTRAVDGGFGILQVLYVPEEHLLLTLAYDARLRAYDARTGSVALSFENPNGALFTRMAFDAAHRELYLSDREGYLWVYDVFDGGVTIHEQVTGVAKVSDEEVKRGSLAPATSVALLREASHVVVLSARGSLVGVRVARETAFKRLGRAAGEGHAGPVIALAVGETEEHGERVFSASLDGAVRQWDSYDLACARVFDEPGPELACLTFAPRPCRLVTGHDDGSIRLWGLDMGLSSTIRNRRDGHRNTASCIVALESRRPEDWLVATGGFDGRVALWNVRPSQHVAPDVIASWDAHPGHEILAVVAFAGDRVATGGNDGVVRVWRGPDDLLAEFQGHEEAVTCLATRGDVLFSGSEDGTVRAWDVSAATEALAREDEDDDPNAVRGRAECVAEPIAVLRGHGGVVSGVHAMRLTGHVLSVAYAKHHRAMNGSAILWDPSAEREEDRKVAVFEHPEHFRCMAVRERDNQALFGTSEGNIIARDAFPPEVWGALGLPPRSKAPATPSVSGDEDSTEEIEDDELADIHSRFESLGGFLEDA